MKTTDEDSEVFEITDFTTASDWERFIAQLEEVIHEWKLTAIVHGRPLPKGELASGEWKETSETVHFADFQFNITRYQLVQPAPRESPPMETSSLGGEAGFSQTEEEVFATVPQAWLDMLSVDNNFPARAHCLCRWYGLRDFVVLAPVSDAIESESRANVLLSSVAIALANTSCQVPLFVQVQQPWRKLYMGRLGTPSFTTCYEMVHLKRAQPQHNHLSGLVDIFKSKIASPVFPKPKVQLSIRFTYIIHDWTQHSWSQEPPDMDSNIASNVGCHEFGELPFGACEDPVSEFHLHVTWPSLMEELIVENDSYSDLDPLQALEWSARVRMVEGPQCLLGEYLQKFVDLCGRQESTYQLLGRSISEADDTVEHDISVALQRLTDPSVSLPSLGNVVNKATSRLQMRPDEAPIAAEVLTEILVFLFPDASDDQPSPDSNQGSEKSAQTTPCMTSSASSERLGFSESFEDFKEKFRQLKSAPPASLTWRLAVCMCIVNHSLGGVRAVAHLWQEFVMEMRYRWENNYPVPDLEPGVPNMGCSLIHQKLQMLNCCIERKLQREEGQGGEASSSDDEEFYECEESSSKLSATEKNMTEGTEKESPRKGPLGSLSSRGKRRGPLSHQSTIDTDQTAAYMDSLPHQPEGRQKPCGLLRLLNIDAPLFVPMTQQPAPMTEEMLEEHAEVLSKLGDSPEGAHLRARMQSACLLSDMESFKAANPGCVLADFVRWYSPRDWVDEEIADEQGNVTKKAQLSQRMQIPGNMWVEVWTSARAVPARRQRRLFDDTKEAEKVLHWLANMKPAEVAHRLLPMLLHAAIVKVLSQEESKLSTLRKLLDRIISKATRLMRNLPPDIEKFDDVVRQLSLAELVIAQAQSLHAKLSCEKGEVEVSGKTLQAFVASLLDQPEVEIVGAANSPLGKIVHRLFANLHKSNNMLADEDEEDFEREDSSRRGSIGQDFPSPAGREYILRTTACRPAPWSRPSPQRMYCVLVKDDFHLAGAFSSDTTFV